MKMRATINVLAAVWAATAGATVGSVISSFRMTTNVEPRAMSIYRDSPYVYGVLDATGTAYLRSYTINGATVGSVTLPGLITPAEADHSLSGPGYVDIFDVGSYQIKTYTLSGSYVKGTPVLDNTTAFGYRPDGDYYYLARYGFIYRYNLDAKLLGSFNAGGTVGGVAVTPVYNGNLGEYVIVGRSGAPGLTFVYSTLGSVLSSFLVPGNGTYGSCVAFGSPGFGRTYWCNSFLNITRWAFQVDIGGTQVPVEPSSLGRVKTLFR